MSEESLDRIDAALVRMRRLWSGSALPLGDGGAEVEMSSVLMVEAVARLRVGGGDVPVGAVARFAGVHASTASRLIDRAVSAGLVARGPSAVDARATTVRLTPAGERVRERATALRTGWLRDVVGDWPDGDVAAFARLLDRFSATVERRGGPR